MKTINEKIYETVVLLAEQKVKIEKTGFLELWQLKNGIAYFTDWDSKRIPEYVESQKALGYNEEELTIEAWTSTSREWYFYIAATIKNPRNGSSYRFSNNIGFISRDKLTKAQLEEAEAPILDLIRENRKMYLNNAEKATEFINDGMFYMNNLEKMKFDKETHDFVLSVKNHNEVIAAQKEKDANTELRIWARENGSELLKLRIKHDQNWQKLAQQEWAKAHVNGDFEPWSFDPDSDKDWTVMNASLDQLKELEAAQAQNPDHEIDIMRSRWNDDDDESPTHRTFLRCRVKTPTSYELLYSEIADASDE